MALTVVDLEGPISALIAAFVFAASAAFVGIKWTGATALVLGAALSGLGDLHARWRRAWTWALTGVAAGLFHYLLPWPEIAVSVARDPRLHALLLPPIFALSGAGSALAFRATMRLGRLFLNDEDEP